MELNEPGGIVMALESGRAQARASLLARQDADDVSHPERLARQYEAMRHDEAAAVLGCRTEVGETAGDGMRRYLEWLDRCIDPAACGREIWIESPIAHPTAMIRASVFDAVGGYRDVGWPEDYDLWLRIHRAGGSIRNLPDRLYRWTDRPGRLSRCDPRYSAESFLRCRLHHLRKFFAEKGIARSLVVWGAGRDGGRLARAWERECSLPGPPAPPIVGFVDIDPRKVGRKRHDRDILDWNEARRRYPGAFYLVAVGVAGAREEIRGALSSSGCLEERDFLCLH